MMETAQARAEFHQELQRKAWGGWVSSGFPCCLWMWVRVLTPFTPLRRSLCHPSVIQLGSKNGEVWCLCSVTPSSGGTFLTELG